MLLEKNGQYPSAWWIMTKTWGRALVGGMSKIEQIKCGIPKT